MGCKLRASVPTERGHGRPSHCATVVRATPAGGGAPPSFEAGPGTYALILHCPAAAVVEVGRLGELGFSHGYYVYIGSAFGPGGLRARVGRHYGTSNTRHWHIDHARALMTPVDTWYSQEQRSCEHAWAGVFIEGWVQATAIGGFGASDCRCVSHLFFMRDRPKLPRFRRALERRAGTTA